MWYQGKQIGFLVNENLFSYSYAAKSVCFAVIGGGYSDFHGVLAAFFSDIGAVGFGIPPSAGFVGRKGVYKLAVNIYLRIRVGVAVVAVEHKEE